ncbi:GTPase ObgE [candidate division KSB3 bacterium]|uniref:GTPase Obg n=1 Tax=candidate division KSB3 bacterium TaxID=2044937 RepID=A0A2G6E7G2_9BACT|nr:MAG: GTPase ObgE [candidate division KSB3 bacterium]PIE30248.1 MAG: GTPase ObgE [candidate division KSB3 bacterium]
MFIDEIEIRVKAGDGGNGCLSFHREKFVPQGGPDGGDGGRGGHVIFEVDPQLSTLVDLRYKRRYKAERGAHGKGSNKHGKNADDLIVRIPPGTIVKLRESGELLADLSTPYEQFLAAKGGDGGRGNARFKSATNQAPRRTEPGWPGEERVLQLELKLLADVGIIGLPNVGKSTLISRISAARPKIANYPFTTLVPNLGVVRVSDYRSFVVVDIPGLIEGASVGTGLGFQFLRHIERTRMFVHLIDISSDTERDPIDDFVTITTELEQYDPDLCRRPQIVVANKLDALRDDKRLQQLKHFCEQEEMPCYAISAVSGKGVGPVIQHISKLLYPTE